jgi:hypothetical protein
MRAKGFFRRRDVRAFVYGAAFLALAGGTAGVVLLVQVILAGQDLGAGGLSAAEAERDLTTRYAALGGPDGALVGDRVEEAYAGVSAALDGATVVIVPSYLVDQLALGRTLGLVDYFSDQVKWLEAQGIATIFAPIDTEASIAENGAALRRFVAGSETPVCFISHSKGGLDTLEALLLMSSDERAKVRCWIALQAPFAGTPLADLAAGFDLGRPLVDEALELLGGSGQSLDDLTTPGREAYLAEHAEEIAEIADETAILAVATRLLPGDGLIPDTPFAASRWWMAQSDIESDGAVPTASAILPHARYLIIDGLDHGDTFDGNRLFGDTVHDDVLFLQAMLALVLGDSD